MLCGSLDARGVWGRMDTCMYMAESLCCSHQTIRTLFINWLGFPSGSVGKESACSAGDAGSIPGAGRSPGRGHGNLLQYSCLENPMDRVGHDWSDRACIPQCKIKSTPPKKKPKQINLFPIFLRNVLKFFLSRLLCYISKSVPPGDGQDTACVAISGPRKAIASSTQWIWIWGDGERQGSLECCIPWGHKELDTTEWTTTDVPLTLSHTQITLPHNSQKN